MLAPAKEYMTFSVHQFLAGRQRDDDTAGVDSEKLATRPCAATGGRSIQDSSPKQRRDCLHPPCAGEGMELVLRPSTVCSLELRPLLDYRRLQGPQTCSRSLPLVTSKTVPLFLLSSNTTPQVLPNIRLGCRQIRRAIKIALRVNNNEIAVGRPTVGEPDEGVDHAFAMGREFCCV
jgi:hypothetical protein